MFRCTNFWRRKIWYKIWWNNNWPMSISLLKMRNPFCRLFEKSTVHCCFYAGGPTDRSSEKQRSYLALWLEVFSLQIFLPKEFSMCQKAAYHSSNVLAMYLYSVFYRHRTLKKFSSLKMKMLFLRPWAPDLQKQNIYSILKSL